MISSAVYKEEIDLATPFLPALPRLPSSGAKAAGRQVQICHTQKTNFVIVHRRVAEGAEGYLFLLFTERPKSKKTHP